MSLCCSKEPSVSDTLRGDPAKLLPSAQASSTTAVPLAYLLLASLAKLASCPIKHKHFDCDGGSNSHTHSTSSDNSSQAVSDKNTTLMTHIVHCQLLDAINSLLLLTRHSHRHNICRRLMACWNVILRRRHLGWVSSL